MGNRVVIIDDDPAQLELGTYLLATDQTYQIRTHSDPVAFLTSKDMWWADLIILDLAMPVISGFGVLAEIRAQRPKLPVIVCTAASDFDDRVRTINQGATSVMLKPIDPGKLRVLVATCLGK